MRRNWYNIQMKGESKDRAEIAIYDVIGATWDGEGVTAKRFIDDLRALGPVQNIDLSINSPGGDVMDGIAIYNALKMTGAKITARVMGMAASAASFVAMAADEIEMPSNTFMMIHNASSFAWGNAETMREQADLLDKIDSTISAMYVKRTGKSETEVKALMAKDTYMTAEEAVSLGFADRVTDRIEATAKFDLDTLPEAVRSAFTNAKPGNTPPAPGSDEHSATITDQVRAAVAKAGLAAYEQHFVMSIDALDKLQPALTAAREIVALCNVAKKPDSAAAFIAGSKSVADVRAALVNALAASSLDEIDTTSGNQGNRTIPKTPDALSTADVWAKRRKLTN